MAQIFSLLLYSARPIQWLKNFVLFTGLIFSGWLFLPEKFFPVLAAFIIFSFLTSAIYIFNDICDVSKDKLHPLKKKRPIASGKLKIPYALFTSILLALTSLFLAANLSFFFFVICLGYLILHIFYTLILKKIAILDVLALASGFILRVYAGAVIIDAHINIWLLLCVISFSLFLAVGKRRSELTLLLTNKTKGQTRTTLFSYPEKLLDLYISMFANTTWLTYAWFSFLYPVPQPSAKLLSLWADIPRTFRNEKWLMATVPVAIYGIMKYLQLIYQRNKGEAPAKVLISNKPLFISVLLWGIMVVGIIYGLE